MIKLKSNKIWGIAILIFLFILIISSKYIQLEKYYLIISLIVITLILLPRFIRFEKSGVDSRETVLIAMLASIGAVARVPFASLPNIQPTSSIIILTGVVFGSEIGFMVGAIAAVTSNIFLGQGPWTPWQMLAFGSMGYFAGVLSKKQFFNNKYAISIFGFFYGFVFGWIMNLWMVIGFIKPINLQSLLAIYAASLPFDLLHGISNLVLIFIMYNSWNKKMNRIKNKYSL